MSNKKDLEILRERMRDLIREYHSHAFPKRQFDPAQDVVPVSGKVFDSEEMLTLLDSTLDFWLTTGRFASQFEERLARFCSVRFASLVNSGSSANLLAVAALTSPLLKEEALQPGDEVITVACGFPTTLNPLLQYGLVPVFVDVEFGTYNASMDQIEGAIGPKTRAIMLAHTLGNPFDVVRAKALAEKHNLYLVEDCCDALGSTVSGTHVGTFGDLATLSFYPAHHITMGEGGCVLTQKPLLKRIVESFRDWGRDCWCQPGVDDTCGKRFGWQLGKLPAGYDHKYIYSHKGFNLKATDMQAAVGVAQLDKLPAFIEARKRNFEFLKTALTELQPHLLLPEPQKDTDPSWFGFPLTLRPTSPHKRLDLLRFLASRRIGTRLLFGGNLLLQPAYEGVVHRIAAPLHNTELIAQNTFWIGLYPGLTQQHLEYTVEQLGEFFRK